MPDILAAALAAAQHILRKPINPAPIFAPNLEEMSRLWLRKNHCSKCRIHAGFDSVQEWLEEHGFSE